MRDDPNFVPPIRLARWLAIGLAICFAVVLYFRFGTKLPPISNAPATPVAADSTR